MCWMITTGIRFSGQVWHMGVYQGAHSRRTPVDQGTSASKLEETDDPNGGDPRTTSDSVQ